MRPDLAVLGCLAFLATTAVGAPVQIRAGVTRIAATGDAAPSIVVHLAGGPAGEASRDELLRVDGEILNLDLPQPGVWYVTPRAAGYWGETRALVTPLVNGPIDLQLWPAATLRAELAPRSLVKQVVVRFQPVVDGEGEGDPLPPAAAADCRVEGKHVECVIPAGRMDYSLRSFGYIPQYRWDQSLNAGSVFDLGRIEFLKGASLIGRVTVPAIPQGRDEVQSRVSVTPNGIPATTRSEDARTPLTVASTVADRRGRFVLEGLTPGAYFLSASAPGLISERREVVILDGLEAELREPLVLTAPLELTVVVDPPTDPWRGPWTMELLRVNRDARVATAVDSGTPDAEGRWNASNLIPGVYVVRVRRAQGVWHSQTVSLTESGKVAVVVPLVKAAGELFLGDTAIPGSIWFGGEFGEISVPVTTDKQGIFRAFLPAVKDNLWTHVDVVADHPPVRASLKNVRLEGPNSKGIATVDIVLPANRLYGEVTTKEGAPAWPVMVYAEPDGDDMLLQIEADEDGAFAFHGLAANSYSVRAVGPGVRSRAVDVTIEKGLDQYLRIVVEKDVAIEGSVSSHYGAVTGARVSVYPEDRTVFGILPWDRTDAEGRFRVAVSPQPRNMSVTVAAPGFAFKIFELPAEPPQPLAVRVEQGGGQLITTDAADPSRRAYLFRGQAFLALAALEAAGAARRDGAQVVVENLEPGQYDVCMASLLEAPALARAARPKERCTGGFLAPGGRLDLRSQVR